MLCHLQGLALICSFCFHLLLLGTQCCAARSSQTSCGVAVQRDPVGLLWTAHLSPQRTAGRLLAMGVDERVVLPAHVRLHVHAAPGDSTLEHSNPHQLSAVNLPESCSKPQYLGTVCYATMDTRNPKIGLFTDFGRLGIDLPRFLKSAAFGQDINF